MLFSLGGHLAHARTQVFPLYLRRSPSPRHHSVPFSGALGLLENSRTAWLAGPSSRSLAGFVFLLLPESEHNQRLMQPAVPVIAFTWSVDRAPLHCSRTDLFFLSAVISRFFLTCPAAAALLAVRVETCQQTQNAMSGFCQHI